jgi:hypothetical protein
VKKHFAQYLAASLKEYDEWIESTVIKLVTMRLYPPYPRMELFSFPDQIIARRSGLASRETKVLAKSCEFWKIEGRDWDGTKERERTREGKIREKEIEEVKEWERNKDSKTGRKRKEGKTKNIGRKKKSRKSSRIFVVYFVNKCQMPHSSMVG